MCFIIPFNHCLPSCCERLCVNALFFLQANSADPSVERMRKELEEKERLLAHSLADVAVIKRKLEEDRQTVDRQMARMNELGRKVKEDSERLAEQARVLHAVTANSPRSAVPTTTPPTSLSKGPASPDAHRVITAPGPIAAVDDALAAHSAHSTPNASREVHRSDAAAAKLMSPASAPLNDAPAELFEPDVMILFDKYKKPLFELWQYYSSLGEDAGSSTASGLDVQHFIEMYADYDIAPTFLTRKELKQIFAASAKAHAGRAVSDEEAVNVPLSYPGFVEALGRTALVALAKPTFQHLYPSARDKVLVLLDMWGMADPRKLQEVQRKPRHKSAARK